MRRLHLISILLLSLIYEPALLEELKVAIVGAGTINPQPYILLIKEYIYLRYRRNVCGLLSVSRNQKCEDYCI